MKKKILFVVFQFLFFTNSFATYNVGITFWVVTQNPTVSSSELQSIVNAVCELNNNHVNNAYGSTGIRFYIYRVKHAIDPYSNGNNAWSNHTGDILLNDVINFFGKDPSINVYIHSTFANQPGNLGQYKFLSGNQDVITMNVISGLSSAALTHEIGHYFSLAHTPGSFQSPTGGQNACGYAWGLNMSGTWMDQGQFNGFFENTVQIPKMIACCNYRGVPQNAVGLAALNYDYLDAIPAVAVQNSQVQFAFSTSCNVNIPVRVDIKVYTKCYEGYTPTFLYYSTTTPTLPINIQTGWGIDRIDYLYTYPDGMQNNTSIVYNIPKQAEFYCNCEVCEYDPPKEN